MNCTTNTRISVVLNVEFGASLAGASSFGMVWSVMARRPGCPWWGCEPGKLRARAPVTQAFERKPDHPTAAARRAELTSGQNKFGAAVVVAS